MSNISNSASFLCKTHGRKQEGHFVPLPLNTTLSVHPDSINRLKTQQEFLSEGQNILWLVYLQIVEWIASDLKDKGKRLRKMTAFEILIQNQ